jgi:hypothetical protein
LVGQEFKLKTSLFEAKVGMMDKMINQLKNGSSWRSLEAKFLVQGFEVAQELDLQRTPLAKRVVMLAPMLFFHPCLKFSTEEVLAIV